MARRVEDPLRPALELAFLVAAMGAKQRPPIDAPTALRPFLRFQKLPDAALEPVRKAIEGDEAFRSRLAIVADEAMLGRAGWLWLARPDGWQAELAELRAAVAASGDDQAADRKRIALERSAREARAEVVSLRAALDRVSRERDDLLAANAKLTTLRAEHEAAVSKLRRKIARLEADREQLPPSVPPLPPAPPVPPPIRLVPPPGPTPSPAPAVDLERVAGLTAQASLLLDELRSLLPAALAVGRPRRTPKPRRVVAPLPRGVAAGSDEAAAWLSARSDVVTIVDGYNVTMQMWGDADLHQQRERLIDAVDGQVARTRAKVRIVFDGSEVGAVPTPRRRVPVTFSPEGVKADEVIVEAVAAVPLAQAVVVVTSDRELRERVELLGAICVHSQQFLRVLLQR